MKWTAIAMGAILLGTLLTVSAAAGQTTAVPAGSQPAPVSSAAPAVGDGDTGSPATAANCQGGPCDALQTRITIANSPSPPSAPWPIRERISWAANLILVILGYVGIMLAVSTLKKIERQTQAAETAATAAAESAQAALLHAQTMAQSERPWILVTAEPSPSIENGFDVTATNRGRTPARIVALGDEIRIDADEKHLPAMPEYPHGEPVAPMIPMFLLPGESAVLKSFCRADVKEVCASDEQLRRIDTWEEKLFLYGSIFYRDLIAPGNQPAHETRWCFWYIHGRQKSGLAMAGPLPYNQHS